jgi:recombinational DNA repair ATPase RecF
MYLSKLTLQNWRTYADATFDFEEPTSRKPIVLIGAMNGHGKTSFLVSLYLGLFGKFGLRYCEGFSSAAEGDISSYKQAIGKYRRRNGNPDEPTVIDITFSPTTLDPDSEEEVRFRGGVNCLAYVLTYAQQRGIVTPSTTTTDRAEPGCRRKQKHERRFGLWSGWHEAHRHHHP